MPSRLAWTVTLAVLLAPLAAGAAVLVGDAGEVDADAATPTRDEAINETAVEQAMHSALNDRRAAEGRDRLPLDTTASAQASAWSARMANGSYEHSPRGYYACPAGTAENIATLPAEGRVELDTGEIVRYQGNETKLGRALIGVWNRSPPHRENMLDRTHTAHAPGVALAERNGTLTVFATSGFCSQ